MTNTGQTIERLNSFRREVQEELAARQIVTFNLNQLEIDSDKIHLDGVKLSKNAAKKALSELRVKSSFVNYYKDLVTDDWRMVKDKLKGAMSDKVVYGRKVKDTVDVDTDVIDELYVASPKNLHALEIDAIFNEVIDAVITTHKDISLGELALTKEDKVVVTLIENDREVNVFGNNEDNWKVGRRITWNGVSFNIMPFYERLVCTNGNTSKHFGFKADISGKKFNVERIRKVLEKEVIHESHDTITRMLTDAVEHLKENNISVNEFLHFKNFFNPTEDKDILIKYFDESYLNKSYGCVVDEKPNVWKMTADTGINAYDFFNNLTYIASHPDEVPMQKDERLLLQIKASDLLFKPVLDLEQCAPKVKLLQTAA